MGDTGRFSAYLGVLADRTELRYINVGTSRRVSQLVFCSLKTQLDDTDAWRVQTRRTCTVYVRVPDLRPARTTPIELRWFGEKSGTVVYTVGEANGGLRGEHGGWDSPEASRRWRLQHMQEYLRLLEKIPVRCNGYNSTRVTIPNRTPAPSWRRTPSRTRLALALAG
ncbi:Os10g0160900 [Oryza sativa Japonica Group]|uniref:Os10g0160900 protein n=1 Tax=Oryza sativa subsp. japonica TaxID=39947 RepID=A0A0P0XS18_ORYSJ|nr:Os10g0160900 [Oryza sativa Japonica Group]